MLACCRRLRDWIFRQIILRTEVRSYAPLPHSRQGPTRVTKKIYHFIKTPKSDRKLGVSTRMESKLQQRVQFVDQFSKSRQRGIDGFWFLHVNARASK